MAPFLFGKLKNLKKNFLIKKIINKNINELNTNNFIK